MQGIPQRFPVDAHGNEHAMPKRSPRQSASVDPQQPKYSITTMAELTGVHPQQLRRLEKAGMLKPARSQGGTRRYSDTDVAQVERLRNLADAGINQAGIERILELETALEAAEARSEAAEADLERLRQTASSD